VLLALVVHLWLVRISGTSCGCCCLVVRLDTQARCHDKFPWLSHVPIVMTKHIAQQSTGLFSAYLIPPG
jgi:hypothetical protein